MKCSYCEKVCISANSLRNHERTCPENPLRVYKNGMTGKTPWNKGLSKETDNRVANHAAILKGRPSKIEWTPERRMRVSQWMKQRHIDMPETHVNRRLANNRNKMTYPEQVAFDWLVKNNIQFEHQKKISKYFVDFCIGNVVIEIDGEHWHPIGNEKDALRDKEISQHGFTVYRIRSKDRIEESLTNILRD